METVKFYAWIERQPSSLTVRISGGQIRHSGGKEEDAMTQLNPLKEVRFNKGLLVTSDEETILTLRRMIKNGETITEDHEVYLSHVLSDKEKTERATKQAKIAVADSDKLREENEKLKKQLAARGNDKLGKADQLPGPQAVTTAA